MGRFDRDFAYTVFDGIDHRRDAAKAASAEARADELEKDLAAARRALKNFERNGGTSLKALKRALKMED